MVSALDPDLIIVEEAVSLFDGVIGWLTYYGYQALRLGHEGAITKTLEEGSKLVMGELENFLSLRPQANNGPTTKTRNT